MAAVKVPGEKDVQKVVVDLSEPKEDKADRKRVQTSPWKTSLNSRGGRSVRWGLNRV